MASKKKSKAKRKRASRQVMKAQTAGLRFLNKMAFVILLILVCAAVGMTVVPQLNELKRLEAELDDSHDREADVLEQIDQRRRELAALRENPEFQELQARDLLELYRPGETVMRIHRD